MFFFYALFEQGSIKPIIKKTFSHELEMALFSLITCQVFRETNGSFFKLSLLTSMRSWMSKCSDVISRKVKCVLHCMKTEREIIQWRLLCFCHLWTNWQKLPNLLWIALSTLNWKRLSLLGLLNIGSESDKSKIMWPVWGLPYHNGTCVNPFNILGAQFSLLCASRYFFVANVMI